MTILLGVLSGIVSYRNMFLGTSVLLVISNIGYALAGLAKSKWLIFFSRIGLGLGAGTLSIVRAYFAESFDEANRTTVLAIAAAVQYGGFALFPGIGDLLDLLTGRFGWNVDNAHISSSHVNLFMNEFTAPAWLMVFFSLLSLVGLWFAFIEPMHKETFELVDLVPFYRPWISKVASGAIRKSILKALGMDGSFEVALVKEDSSFDQPGIELLSMEEEKKEEKHGKGKEEASSTSGSTDDEKIHLNDEEEEHHHHGDHNKDDDDDDDRDMVPLRFENDQEAPSEDENSNKSVFNMVTAIWISFLFINFLIRLVLGTVEVLGATLYDEVTKKYIPVGESTYHLSSGAFYTILGAVGVGVVLGLAFFAKKLPDQIPFLASLIALLLGSLTLIGNLTSMSLARFTFGVGLMYTIGYPLAQSVVVSMFSKISASQRNQAVSMSWIGSAGSIGRIVGPIAVGAIYQHKGAAITFIFNSSIAAVLLILSLVTLYFMRTTNH
jgi:ceroid-lipofuscinosis MFS transporter 7